MNALIKMPRMPRTLPIRKQFSLAALFVVVTLSSVPAAWYGMRLRAQEAEERARRAEDRALVSIGKKGAEVHVYPGYIRVEFLSREDIAKRNRVPRCGTGVYGPSGSPSDFLDCDLALFDDVRRPIRVDFRLTSVSSGAVERFCSKHPGFQVER